MTDAFFKAAQHGVLNYFKNQTVSFDTPYEKSGDTALHIAARCGHVCLLEYLLSSGADKEISNLDGKRPLHEAAQTGQLECVQCLLKSGAQVDSLKRADWLVVRTCIAFPSQSQINLTLIT